MMSRIRTVLAVSLLLLATNAVADTIEYTIENLGGSSWQYNYTVINTGADALEAFAVYFDFGVYENLDLISSPADWDPLVIQPDLGLPDDGFVDSLAFAAGVAPGEMLGGFSVSFDFLETGTPGDQFFDIFDLNTVDIMAVASLRESMSLRCPNPLLSGLFAIGLFLMLTFAKRRRRPTLALHSQ